MACVPGGKVMAKVRGSPAARAAWGGALSGLGSAPTLPLSSAFKVIDCPLRLRIQGTTIGFFGEPSRPNVEAMGMPSSMCVAWMSPLLSESRIAAQLAPLLTTLLMPCFLNRPFSWAITMGEQSVSAIIPNFISLVSGASLAHTRPVGRSAAASAVRLVPTNARRLRDVSAGRGVRLARIVFMSGSPCSTDPPRRLRALNRLELEEDLGIAEALRAVAAHRLRERAGPERGVAEPAGEVLLQRKAVEEVELLADVAAAHARGVLAQDLTRLV